MNRISKGVIGLSLAASMFSCETESLSPNQNEKLVIESATDSGLLKSDNIPSLEDWHRMKEIIAEYLGVSEDDVVFEASFVDDLGADSLDTVEIIMAIEEEFNILIPDEVSSEIATVGDLYRVIYEAT